MGELLDIVTDTVRFDYDAAGQLLSEQGANGKVQYERDMLGNAVAVRLPDGQLVQTLYYGSGHAHQIQIDGEVIADFERDALHREIVRTQGSLALHTNYTPMGQIAWQRASVRHAGQGVPTESESALWWRNQYDSRGELVESVDRLRGRTVYDYDRAGHLLWRSAEISDIERFTWDAAGNLLDDEGGVSAHKMAPLLDNLLRRYRGIDYTYDAWGQLIRRNHLQLGWDGEGHLLWSDDGIVRARYQYDALGRRIGKRVFDVARKSERHTRFVWEGLRLVQEREGEASSRTYVYDPKRTYAPLARVDRSSDTAKMKVFYYQTDPTGTARDVTDAEGRVVWSGSYAAWGAVRANVARSGPFEQALRMPGQYCDEESGLHYNLFRYYDPHAGRFISQDPIGLAGGLNLYQYAPNPIGWIDPWGLATVDAIFEMAGRVFTGVNPTERVPRIDGPTLSGMSGPNNSRFDMHAEIDAMLQAHDEGLRGGKGTLTIEGKEICSFCKRSLKNMAQHLGLDELTIHEKATGKIYKFSGDDFNKVRNGGKGFKNNSGAC
nr:RHS repeat-associated core domain-containing protein [Caballeronia sp. ATUFL_F2_KS9A]